MSIGYKIKTKREELGLTQRELAKRMGYNNHSTLTKIETGKVDVPYSRLVQFAEILDTPITYFVEDENEIQNNNLGKKLKEARIAKGMTQEDVGNLLGIQKSAVAKYENGRVINLKKSSLKILSDYFNIPLDELMSDDLPIENESVKRKPTEIFAKNLKFYMLEKGVRQKDLSKIIGVSAPTFCDYYNGRKYPRPEKMRAIADYFNIDVSDLVDDGLKKHPDISMGLDKNAILSVIAKLQSDDDFANLVYKMSKLDSEQLIAIKQLLSAFFK